jgi:hypothetical protein
MGLFGKKHEEDKANKDVIMSGVYPGISPSRLFNAIMLAGAKLSYSIDFIDKGSFSVTFQTHKNEKFWDGRLSAFVLDQSGGAKVSVSGSADRGVTTSGRGSGNLVTAATQLASQGGASQQQAKLRFEIARQVKNAEDDPEVTSPIFSPDLSTQISKLKDLMDSGALTQEEFEKAKAKILG